MSVKLLTEHYLEFLSLKGSCTGSSESTLQNATLLEISCRGSGNFICSHLMDAQYEVLCIALVFTDNMS